MVKILSELVPGRCHDWRNVGVGGSNQEDVDRISARQLFGNQANGCWGGEWTEVGGVSIGLSDEVDRC